jgi:hypothetical protein
VTDQSGNVPNGVQFVAGSGTPYNTNGVVPEPGSLLLLAGGIALMAAVRHRFSR